MAKHFIGVIELEDLCAHPAVVAWAGLEPQRVVPTRIVSLKERHKMSDKSAVFRLEGVAPGGGGVVAKRCRRWSALLERRIYAEFLPRFPVPSLGFQGFVEEPDTDYCWLFTEDVGDVWYRPQDEAHRILAARWLAKIHLHAARLDLEGFPDRGLTYYRHRLQLMRTDLERLRHSPSLHEEHRLVMNDLMTHCGVVDEHWRVIETVVNKLPVTLVHGDLVRKNLRIRNEFGTAEFFAVDWENAGVGSPATDLARSPSVTGLSDFTAAPSIAAYWSSVRHHWTELSRAAVREAANIGLIFRCLSSIQWEIERLDANGYVERCMPRLAIFRDGLTEAVAAAGWS